MNFEQGGGLRLVFLKFGTSMMVAVSLFTQNCWADIPKPRTLPLPVVPSITKPVDKPPESWPPEPATRAEPAENPGLWVTSDDYPVEALRYNIAGILALRLLIDPDGKVSYCQISESTGFDVLDEAACNLMTRRAVFKPARDKSGHAVADSWYSRFVWRIPQSAQKSLKEWRSASTVTLDRFGSVTSCRVSIDTKDNEDSTDSCDQLTQIPHQIGLAMRGYGAADGVNVEIELDFVLDKDRYERLIEYKKGEGTAALLAWRIEINRSGVVVGCKMNLQRGRSSLMTDMCYRFYDSRFMMVQNGSFSSGDLTQAWFVFRVSRDKTL